MGIDKITLERLRSNDPTLTELSLINAQVGPKDVYELAEALKGNKILEILGLSYNPIGDDTLQQMTQERTGPETITLALESTGYGGQALADALKVNNTVTTLYLARTVLVYYIADLAEALKVNQSLTTLDLSLNNLDVEEAELIAEVLRINQTLTTLYLANNNLKSEGIIVLADALKDNKSLTLLELSDNNLGFEGEETLAEIESILKNNRIR